MKIKTSITIEETLLKKLDTIASVRCSRSRVIEDAVRAFLLRKEIEDRELRDFAILNQAADQLNHETRDLVALQDDE